MSALPQGADVYPNAGRGRKFGHDTIIGVSQAWKRIGATKTAERRLADKPLRPNGHGLMDWAVANARG